MEHQGCFMRLQTRGASVVRCEDTESCLGFVHKLNMTLVRLYATANSQSVYVSICADEGAIKHN